MLCKKVYIVNSEDKDKESESSGIPKLLQTVPEDTLHIITGNILGDGSLRRVSRRKDGTVGGNASFSITMIASSKDYIIFLRNNVYAAYGLSRLRERPNTLLPHHVGKKVVAYEFETRTSPILTELHSL